jgi:hypothetical protein
MLIASGFVSTCRLVGLRHTCASVARSARCWLVVVLRSLPKNRGFIDIIVINSSDSNARGQFELGHHVVPCRQPARSALCGIWLLCGRQKDKKMLNSMGFEPMQLTLPGNSDNREAFDRLNLAP